MLGQKIQEIKQRKTNDQLLSAYFNIYLINKLKNWKDERNDLMHAMADSTKTIDELNKATYLLSQNSKSLVKETCKATRLLKKNREKAAT